MRPPLDKDTGFQGQDKGSINIAWLKGKELSAGA
jgi:hypothetical protein